MSISSGIRQRSLASTCADAIMALRSVSKTPRPSSLALGRVPLRIQGGFRPLDEMGERLRAASAPKRSTHCPKVVRGRHITDVNDMEPSPRFLGISTALNSGWQPMYGDDESWPVKCPSCGHGFAETIGRIKSRMVSSCPRCSLVFVHSRKQFLFALSEAREGRHNPWWEILASQQADK